MLSGQVERAHKICKWKLLGDYFVVILYELLNFNQEIQTAFYIEVKEIHDTDSFSESHLDMNITFLLIVRLVSYYSL